MNLKVLIILPLLLAWTVKAQVRTDSTQTSGSDSLTSARGTVSISLRSDPEGAEVYHDSLLLGRTPLVHRTFGDGTVLFKLFFPDAKHWDATTTVDTITVRNRQDVSSIVDMKVRPGIEVRKSITPTTESDPNLFLSPNNNGDSHRWLRYTAGATMVLSGVFAAYIKAKSDKDFDSYVATGDPSLLSSTQRLDRLSGASLFITELSLGVLMYLLLSD